MASSSEMIEKDIQRSFDALREYRNRLIMRLAVEEMRQPDGPLKSIRKLFRDGDDVPQYGMLIKRVDKACDDLASAIGQCRRIRHFDDKF